MERGPTPCICGDALHEPTRLARTRADVHEPWGWTPWNAVRRNACAATGIKGQCSRRVECDGTRCNSMCSETLQEVSLLCHRRWAGTRWNVLPPATGTRTHPHGRRTERDDLIDIELFDHKGRQSRPRVLRNHAEASSC